MAGSERAENCRIKRRIHFAQIQYRTARAWENAGLWGRLRRSASYTSARATEARCRWNGVSRQLVWIARTIKALVVVPHDPAVLRKSSDSPYSRPIASRIAQPTIVCCLHDTPLVGSQSGRFEQDLVGQHKFSNVVQGSAAFQLREKWSIHDRLPCRIVL